MGDGAKVFSACADNAIRDLMEKIPGQLYFDLRGPAIAYLASRLVYLWDLSTNSLDIWCLPTNMTLHKVMQGELTLGDWECEVLHVNLLRPFPR